MESDLHVQVSETETVVWKCYVCANIGQVGAQNSLDMQQKIVFPISK